MALGTRNATRRRSRRVTKESDTRDLKRGEFSLEKVPGALPPRSNVRQRKPAAQRRALPLGAVDAGVRHQPGRQEAASRPGRFSLQRQ
jgi:hypothetical protein